MKKSKSITGIPYDKCLRMLESIEIAKANLNKLHEVLSEKICEPLFAAFDHHIDVADIALNGLDHEGIITYYMFECLKSEKLIKHGRKKWKLDSVEDLAKYICRKREKP